MPASTERTTGRAPSEGANPSVDHPEHYNVHPSGVECIEIVRHMGFNLGNVVKYLWRDGIKDAEVELQDLEKAAWYLQDEIKGRKAANDNSRSGDREEDRSDRGSPGITTDLGPTAINPPSDSDSITHINPAQAGSGSAATEDQTLDQSCLARWPGAFNGGYNPSCCRFPKSCSISSEAEMVRHG